MELTELDALEVERQLCLTDLKYLCQKVLGFQDWDECHDVLWCFLKQSKRRKKLIMLPRGHLKTSIVTIGWSLQRVLNDPNLTVLMASAILGNAKSFLSEAKAYMSDKSILPKLFGKFESGVWNQDECTVLQRAKANKTPTFSTAGQDKALTSQHYDLILLDDIVNRQTISTKDQIEGTRQFFSDSLDLLNPGGQLVAVGTSWDDGDLYSTIQSDFADEFDIFVMKATEDGEIDGRVVFPKKFTNDALRELKKQKGTYEFYCQYMNSPVSKESRHFKPPVRYWNEVPKDACHTISVDLAISDKDNADFVVIMDVAKARGQWFVNKYFRGHYDVATTIEKIFEMVSFVPHGNVRILVESIAYQRALAQLLETEKGARNVSCQIVPVMPHRDKFTRVMALQPIWEQGNLLLRQGMIELEDELERFPMGKHDDLIDALAMQLTVDAGVASNLKGTGAWIHPRFRMKMVA